MNLRDYQKKCNDTTFQNFSNGENESLIVLPTSSGKTIIFCDLVNRSIDLMEKNNKYLRSLILVNQVRLVEQTRDKLLNFIDKDKIGVFCGSLNIREQNQVTVATIQSFKNETPFINLLIVDEAHNFTQSTVFKKFKERLIEKNPKIRIVYYTATPWDKQGTIFGEGKLPAPIFRRYLADQIKDGFITPYKFNQVKEEFDTSQLKLSGDDFLQSEVEKLTKDRDKARKQVRDALSRLKERNKIVWACTCIKHAEMIKEEIERYEECTIINSKLKRKEQIENLEVFEKGQVRHITSITMVSEGYDSPIIDGIVCLRPTRSPRLYVQLLGRGLRLSSGKVDCLFLDYGGCVEALGDPNSPYVREKGEKRKKERRVILCPECEEINFIPATECACGYEFLKPKNINRDPYKKLTLEAYSEHGIEVPLNVLHFTTQNYISQKGNECILVKYITMRGEIREYIRKDMSWKINQFIKDQENGIKTIIAKKEGKWWQVVERLAS